MSGIRDAIARIINRRQAYRRVFEPANRDARVVLEDLRRFCGADRPITRVSPVSRVVDPHATLVQAGRFEVYQRIQAYLAANDEDLLRLQDHQPQEEDREP